MLTIALILGSTRPVRLSTPAAEALAKALRARGHTVHIIDPAVTPLPLLQIPYQGYADASRGLALHDLGALLASADAYVTVCGEYNHGVPPALLNILDHFPRSLFNAKPAGIFTYSSGPWGGRMAAAHLRTILPELGMVSIPTLLSVPNANSDSFTSQVFVLSNFIPELEHYARALRAAKPCPQAKGAYDQNAVE